MVKSVNEEGEQLTNIVVELGDGKEAVTFTKAEARAHLRDHIPINLRVFHSKMPVINCQHQLGFSGTLESELERVMTILGQSIGGFKIAVNGSEHSKDTSISSLNLKHTDTILILEGLGP